MIALLSTIVLVRANEFGFGKLQEPYEAEELSPLEGKSSPIFEQNRTKKLYFQKRSIEFLRTVSHKVSEFRSRIPTLCSIIELVETF